MISGKWKTITNFISTKAKLSWLISMQRKGRIAKDDYAISALLYKCCQIDCGLLDDVMVVMASSLDQIFEDFCVTVAK